MANNSFRYQFLALSFSPSLPASVSLSFHLSPSPSLPPQYRFITRHRPPHLRAPVGKGSEAHQPLLAHRGARAEGKRRAEPQGYGRTQAASVLKLWSGAGGQQQVRLGSGAL